MKKHRAPIGPIVLILLLAAGHAGAQAAASASADAQYWMLLEKGKRLFREAAYGDAILMFEDAIRQRRALYERSRQALVDAMSLTEVRRLGDSLDAVEQYIDAQKLAAARSALDVLYDLAPKASLRGSAAAALSKMSELRSYPEGEYWLGEVFRVEGETALALTQYR